MTIREVQLGDDVLAQLVALSVDRERERACHGYRRNGPVDIEGDRAILHFYIDELGMGFWYARLYKRLGK